MQIHFTANKAILFSYEKLFELHKLYLSLLRSSEISPRKKSRAPTAKAIRINLLGELLWDL